MVLDRLARWAPLGGTIAVGLIVAGWVLMAYFSYYPDAERALEIVSAEPFRFQRGAVFVGVYARFSTPAPE